MPLSGVLPYPTDLYFSGSTDGTLNSPVTPFLPNAAAINALDGYSTNASATARFSAPIDPATVSAATVFMIEVDVDNATKATVGFRRLLVFGTDFTARVAPTLDSGGATLEIVPLKPLTPSTGATNVGYLIVLTNGLRDTSGNAATPDRDYLTILQALPTCAGLTGSMNGICLLTGAQLQLTGAVLGGAVAASAVLTFSFSTQATADTMNFAAALAQPGPIARRADRPQPSDAECGAAADRRRLRRAARDPVLPRPGESAHRPLGRRAGRSGRAVDEPDAVQPRARRQGPARHPSLRHRAECRERTRKARQWLAGRDLPARHHGQPHAGGCHRRRLRLAGLRRRRDRHSAARHHRLNQPAVPARRRAHVRSRPREQHDRRFRCRRRDRSVGFVFHQPDEPAHDPRQPARGRDRHRAARRSHCRASTSMATRSPMSMRHASTSPDSRSAP